MPEDKPDLIIIGAGLAGLTAGVYAQLNGYKTVIYEHHSKPGGVVATWKRGDFTIEGGMHFLMGYQPGQVVYDLYETVGVMPGLDVAPMETYMSYIDAATGRRVTLTSDPDQAQAALTALSPADSSIVKELYDGARKVQRSDFGMGMMTTAPELQSLTDKAKMYWALRGFLKYFTGRFTGSMTEYTRNVSDPFLKNILNNFFLPESPVWFVIMLLGMLADGGIGMLRNGSLDFAERIVARFKDLGGTIQYRSTVEEILVENNHAVGVRLEDGTEHRAGAVIAACDGHSTIFKLLKGDYADKGTREHYETWPLMRPFVFINFGLNKTFNGEPPFGIVFPKTPIKAGAETYEIIGTRIFNYTDAYAPAGKTVFQVYMETTWEEWENLRADKQAYDAQKKATVAAALEFYETYYPELTAAVEMTDVATPYTLWRYTLNHHGAYEGWLPTTEVILKTLPRTLPGLKDFFMAGQWVIPGGGVPPSMFTGMNAVQLLAKRDKKNWIEK